MPRACSEAPRLMVGPLGGPISGQMVAFREAVEAVPNSIAVDAAFTSLFDVLRFWSRLPSAFFRSQGSVYLTTSRSLKGFWLRDLPVFLCAVLARRQLVNHLHGSDFLAFRRAARWPTIALIDLFYRRISIACVPAKNLVTQYADYPATQVWVVPNFFDAGLLTAEQKKSESGVFELLYFSNFIASKGFTKAFETARLLRERGLDVRLTLCGEIMGTTDMGKADVRAFLEEISTEDWITVRPSLSGQAKLEVLSRAHVMLLPTRYPTEAAPISLIEGLAAGCYVVSTDQGSIPELLEGFVAAIVEPEPVVIAASVEEWINRPDRESIAQRNRALALERYSPAAYRLKIREVLNAIEPRP